MLLDADDNLFPSEAPAFDASAEVTTRFLARFDVSAPLSGDELRKKAVGKNFRSTATDLAVLSGVPFEKALADGRPDAVVASDSDVASGRALTADELEQWVRQEREQVTAHLAVTLKPDPEVLEPLQDLASRYAMAAVSSSALARLKASFTAAGLDPLDPGGLRFSAEDSLPVPTSKPDPAVYMHAGRVLGVEGSSGLAVEDSVPGVKSAVAAGYFAVGNVMFVPADERRQSHCGIDRRRRSRDHRFVARSGRRPDVVDRDRWRFRADIGIVTSAMTIRASTRKELCNRA